MPNVPNLPNLTLSLPAAAKQPRGITLVVYAPLGENSDLSRYNPPFPPADASPRASDHPLAQAMRDVAGRGVNTVALLDRFERSSWLQEISAKQPQTQTWTRRGPLEMRDPKTLSDLIIHAAQRFPGTAIVLALEGHGAGYMPDVQPPAPNAPPPTAPPATGAPILGMGSPLLPGGAPMPTLHLGLALETAFAKLSHPLSVIHLNNCFNMSLELLHTIAPYAEFATAYLNYNFFTAGGTYKAVFDRVLAEPGQRASTAQLARWFAEENRNRLASFDDQPTAGGAVQLSRLSVIASAVDTLAAELVTAMTIKSTTRMANVLKIRQAIFHAQQYDADSNMALEVPDALTDLGSLASQLTGFDGDNAQAVQTAATNLLHALAGIRVYGVNGSPYIAPEQVWNLDRPALAMNIFCPDPLRLGQWDWRSPHYLQLGPDELKTPRIGFLRDKPNWVNFIVEYHRDVAFGALLPVPVLQFPLAKY